MLKDSMGSLILPEDLAKRQASFLGDIRDARAAGLEPDQATVDRLAKAYEVPTMRVAARRPIRVRLSFTSDALEVLSDLARACGGSIEQTVEITPSERDEARHEFYVAKRDPTKPSNAEIILAEAKRFDGMTLAERDELARTNAALHRHLERSSRIAASRRPPSA